MNVRYATQDKDLAGYHVMRFDRATGIQTDDARCVLKSGTSAKSFARDLYKVQSNSVTTASGLTLAHIGDGTACFYTYSTSEMDCDGTLCHQYAALRLPASRGSVVSSNGVDRYSGGIAGIAGDLFNCDDGSGFVDNGDGTGNWWPAGDVPIGGDGGGGCGGGSGGGDTTHYAQLIATSACYADPTLSCGSSTLRGEMATCTFGAQGATPTAMQWKFVSALDDTLIGPTQGVSWSGQAVFSGTVTVDFTAGGVQANRSATLSVTPRAGWSWNALVGGQSASGVEIDDCFPQGVAGSDQVALTANINCTVTGLELFDIKISSLSNGNGVLLSAVLSGPNQGYWYVLSASANMRLRKVLKNWFRSDGPASASTGLLAALCDSAQVNTVSANACGGYASQLSQFNSQNLEHEQRHIDGAIAAAQQFGNNVYALWEPIVDRNQSELLSTVRAVYSASHGRVYEQASLPDHPYVIRDSILFWFASPYLYPWTLRYHHTAY